MTHTPSTEDSDDEKNLQKFLSFLEMTIRNSPNILKSTDQAFIDSIDNLLNGIEIDLDSPLDENAE